tara:strand:+ start:17 stop:469 length:453 start_codon:yes stop_codon:yes gene_type:complete
MKELVIKNADPLYGCLVLMNEKEGHGLSYELNYNIFKLKPLLVDFYNRLKESKESFFEKDNNGVVKRFRVVDGKNTTEIKEGENVGKESIGFSVVAGKVNEFNIMIEKFNNELLSLDLKEFDNSVIKKAIKKSIFDGINLAPLFEAGLLK